MMLVISCGASLITKSQSTPHAPFLSSSRRQSPEFISKYFFHTGETCTEFTCWNKNLLYENWGGALLCSLLLYSSVYSSSSAIFPKDNLPSFLRGIIFLKASHSFLHNPHHNPLKTCFFFINQAYDV